MSMSLFLAIPTELRARIYSFYLREITIQTSRIDWPIENGSIPVVLHGEQPDSGISAVILLPSLMLASKEIHHEVQPIIDTLPVHMIGVRALPCSFIQALSRVVLTRVRKVTVSSLPNTLFPDLRKDKDDSDSNLCTLCPQLKEIAVHSSFIFAEVPPTRHGQYGTIHGENWHPGYFACFPYSFMLKLESWLSSELQSHSHISKTESVRALSWNYGFWPTLWARRGVNLDNLEMLEKYELVLRSRGHFEFRVEDATTGEVQCVERIEIVSNSHKTRSQTCMPCTGGSL
jgi:hypothetical protein